MKRISKFKKTLRIRGARWTIRLQEFLRDEGTPCLGLCVLDQKLILIEKHLPRDLFIETLLHEYLHAVWFELGIDDQEPPEALEHWVINGICKDMVLNSTFFRNLF